MDARRLAQLAPFSSLAEDEAEHVARWADEVVVAAGEPLVREGDFAHEFFVIVDGSLAVTQDGETIAELGRGDVVGEIGLFATARRTASVVARTPVRAVVVFQRDFERLEREAPAVAARIRAAINDRFAAPPG